MALRLTEAGHEVVLLDDEKPESASQVAAGLFNVITGRLGVKSWKADLLLANLKEFLFQENRLDLGEWVHPLMIYRPFKAIEEYNKWLGRASDPEYEHLVSFQEKALRPDVLHNELGGIQILPCGWVDIPGLIAVLKADLQSKGMRLIQESVDYQQIDINRRQVSTQGMLIDFDQIVFCEGYRSANNPFFEGLRIIPNKGEILVIVSEDLKLDFVLSRKVYLIPLDENRYVVGSTYANSFGNMLPSIEGREEICMHLKKAIKVPFQVVKHRAGIRPTTPNRRPVVGTHPELGHVHICTGFGTKGLLYAPWCSMMLARNITEPGYVQIPSEISPGRFC